MPTTSRSSQAADSPTPEFDQPIRRFFSDGSDPYLSVEWERRSAELVDHRDGSSRFRQDNVEFPATWSLNASNIVAQKYFAGSGATRESSLRQLVTRVVDAVVAAGVEQGVFDGDDSRVMGDELTWILLHQRATFNSPVWFNIGVPGRRQQASACYILSVEDSMAGILDWYRREGLIFKGGSGAGANLSAIRSSREAIATGGVPSGPVSFMRGADASAGTIRSGGTTRRAAKMVILDDDHPDIAEFIGCKAVEERKARALRDAGFDVDLDGVDAFSLQYQNANNSVRLSDEFMRAAAGGEPWPLKAVTTGEVTETLDAAHMLRSIASAAWECADPGVQFDTTINRWHTTPSAGRINGSNPCSEYMHLDDSACNLASINLLAFLDEDGHFDVDGFEHTVAVMITAQDILVGASEYPTPEITANARSYRQLGLGYANLGALLMALGLPYDSDAARAWAGSITSLMTAAAYLTSTRLAARIGAFDGYDADASAVQAVLDQHRSAADELVNDRVDAPLAAAAVERWNDVVEAATTHGVRNSQATVLAPTGTISFFLDCDTTGIEPDFGLVKFKKLVGGGSMSIANRTVGRALRRLGYAPDDIAAIEAHVVAHNTVVDAPGLDPAHYPVFACSVGDNTIAPRGHIAMMAAVQPFLSGAISKTCNLPESATIDDVETLIVDAWTLGLKAVAVYRDNCKVGQPLSAGSAPGSTTTTGSLAPNAESVGSATNSAVTATSLIAELADGTSPAPERQRLPRTRRSRTFEFRVADCKGFATVGEYEDGRPGELFVRVSKQGSTLAGIMDAFAIAVSHGLQYGVPFRAYVDAFVGMRFEPAGLTDDPEVRFANSLMDYLFRRLALEYLDSDDRHELGIYAVSERLQPTLPGVEEASTPTVGSGEVSSLRGGGPLCMTCGVAMQRAGSCFVCRECGTTSGCS